MRTRLWMTFATAALAATSLPVLTGTAQGVAAPGATIGVGAGASMWPAFAPAIPRYAVSPAADGSVQVAVVGAEAVAFDGVPDADGARLFTGLAPGDEISVFVDDGSGSGRHALYVLPQGFPRLAGTVSGAVAPGLVALTLNRFDGGTAPRFEAIVDRQGVPTYTRRITDGTSTDLKQSPSGALTVHRPTSTASRTGTALVELGDQMQEVARRETVGRVDTDNHDGLLMPDGSVWLVGYEPNEITSKIDSVIQHVAADGTVLFDWSTAAYADETTVANQANPDYAHINSIDVQANGDVVASFRHFGSVWRIAGADRPGTQKYDVVWKLGGRDSSFSFAPGEDGPCAQHTATLLPNGNVLMFDNGGNVLFGARCVDQDDPGGALVDRSSTRVVEWDIDEVAGTATVARQYGARDRFSGFAGGAFKLSNGNVLIAWAPSRLTLANEVSADDAPVWELKDTATESERYTSYRAQLVTVPDRIDPAVTLDGLADGTTVAQGNTVPVTFSCTDRGGSTLQACDGPAGRRLDTTTAGTRTWSVTARDGAGRTTTVTRSYTVAAAPTTAPPTTAPPAAPAPAPRPASPDLSLRVPRGPWVGAGDLAPTAQTARAAVRAGRTTRAYVRVRNVGNAPGRFLLTAPSSLAEGTVEVAYVHRGRARTRAISGRGWRAPVLDPGESLRLEVRVTALPGVNAGRSTVRVRASSAAGHDRVRLVVRQLPAL
ncbi:aryl-sulfate sulfotransferase [Nocardioides zhouii]|uniref:Uncharacterized protein n=1 Tax=Nocardioides zhouii TaxID=1168729 RepID=A0A4Q2SXX1_9ACTN|nr:aryl-sulfate sulfotransferase [Nocardioides zhouii]RYC10802.1 hypothetical protein EUA94_11335 [Nocardioides zhouii]